VIQINVVTTGINDSPRSCEVVSIQAAARRFKIRCKCTGSAKNCPVDGDMLHYAVTNPG
jgi:hypothetical protein